MAIKVPVEYDTDASGLDKQLTGDTKAAGSKAGRAFGSSFNSGAKSLLKGAALLGGLNEVKNVLGDSIDEAREAQKVGALTTNTLKRTGGQANVSAKQIGDYANEISRLAGIDDETIQSGENLLLTFTNIRNEAGKGNDIFRRTTAASVDLAAGLAAASGSQINLRSSTTLLGKALNDPLKGMTALRKAGVEFTDEQKAQIKALVKNGDSLKAQKILIGAVEERYKGAAASQATSSDHAQVAIKNLEESIGGLLLPVVDDLANFVSSKAVPAIQELVTEFQDGTGTGGEIRDVLSDIGDVLGDVYSVGKNVVGFFNDLPGPVKKTAVELLIAYAALSKVNTIMRTLGTTGPATLIKGLANSETRLATVGAQAFKFGGVLRTAAGAGGVLALTDGLQHTNDTLGAVETTLGGAAVGFSVGGPLGAAIGGTAGLLKVFSDNVLHSGDSAKQAAPEFHDYASSIDQVTGAATDATKALLVQDLQQNGVLKTTRDLGISDRAVVQGLTGNAKARLNLVSQLRAQSTATDLLQSKQAAALAKDISSGKISYSTAVARAKAISSAHDATQKDITALLKQAGVLDGNRLKQLQANVATAQGKKGVQEATRQLEIFGKTHAIGTAELHGYSTVKKQALEMQALLSKVFNPKPTDFAHGGTLGSLLGADIVSGGTGSGGGKGGKAPIVRPASPRSTAPSFAPAAPTAPTAPAPIIINQNDYGPTTSRAKIADLTWALRYGTSAQPGRG